MNEQEEKEFDEEFFGEHESIPTRIRLTITNPKEISFYEESLKEDLKSHISNLLAQRERDTREKTLNEAVEVLECASKKTLNGEYRKISMINAVRNLKNKSKRDDYRDYLKDLSKDI